MTNTKNRTAIVSPDAELTKTQLQGIKSQIKKKLMAEEMSITRAKIQVRSNPALAAIVSEQDLINWSQGIDTGRRKKIDLAIDCTEEEYAAILEEEAIIAKKKAAKAAQDKKEAEVAAAAKLEQEAQERINAKVEAEKK